MRTHDANEGLAAFIAKRQPLDPPMTGASRCATPHRCRRSSSAAQALFEDLDFNAVKEWKAAVPGRKAIGYMPVYVPREIDPRRRHAAGGHPRRRRPLEVIQGDAYYQSYICRIPRSTIELGPDRAGSTASTACCSRRSAT